MSDLISHLQRHLPDGLSYDDAAQLCLRLHCVIEGVPEPLRPQIVLPDLADAFAELARSGWILDPDSLMQTFYGARLHQVTDRGHWVEVIASLYKKGDVVDASRGEALAIRAGLSHSSLGERDCTNP